MCPEAPLDLSGKTVLLTGASSGIGRACAQTFAGLGARVGMVARNEERLAATAESLVGQGHAWWSFDLANTVGIPDAMSLWRDELGAFDGLVHCAGVQSTRPVRMESRKSMETMFSVNVYAAMQLSASLFAQKAANASGGGIVLVSSAAALMGGKGIACYSASKGALLSLARSMAIELADRSWRVNAVAPGWVTGEMFDHFQKIAPEEAVQSIVRKHPLGIGEPGDIAAAIAFLLSDHSKWITGAVLAVDGGLTAAM